MIFTRYLETPDSERFHKDFTLSIYSFDLNKVVFFSLEEELNRYRAPLNAIFSAFANSPVNPLSEFDWESAVAVWIPFDRRLISFLTTAGGAKTLCFVNFHS
jgi:hypothetical protein